MVSSMYQAELERLSPERRTGRQLDEKQSKDLGMPFPQGVNTEGQASEYLKDVTQRLKEVQ
jgi:hypothetical protein